MLQNYLAELSIKEKLIPNVYRFEFKLLKPNSLEFQAGQYLLLEIPNGYRQYSIASSPQIQDRVEIVVDMTPMGPGSRYLLDLSLKNQVKLRAPLGLFTLKNNSRPKVFLATGAGIAPFKSMFNELLLAKETQPLFLLWGVKTKEHLYFLDFFENLKNKHLNFDYRYCLSQEKTVISPCVYGRIQQHLSQLNQPLEDCDFYLCGRTETVNKLRQFLIEELKIDLDKIHYENFT